MGTGVDVCRADVLEQLQPTTTKSSMKNNFKLREGGLLDFDILMRQDGKLAFEPSETLRPILVKGRVSPPKKSSIMEHLLNIWLYSFVNLETRPVPTHSATKMLPLLSKQASCG